MHHKSVRRTGVELDAEASVFGAVAGTGCKHLAAVDLAAECAGHCLQIGKHGGSAAICHMKSSGPLL